jgi:hypothetical protein
MAELVSVADLRLPTGTGVAPNIRTFEAGNASHLSVCFREARQTTLGRFMPFG